MFSVPRFLLSILINQRLHTHLSSRAATRGSVGFDVPSEIRMASSGIVRPVAIVRTDVSEELSASFIRVTRIGELGITLDVTSNRRKGRCS
jgi:hypothetical protein